MRYLACILLLAIICFSCQSKQEQQNSDPAKVTPVSNSVTVTDNETQKLINEFKPIIQGVWVKKDYIEKIDKTKSPLAAFDLAQDITAIDINTDKIVGDSLTIFVGYGNHEGGDLTFKFVKGKNPKSITSKYYEMTYDIKASDTTITLHRNNEGKTAKIQFVKALAKRADISLQDGLDFLVNKVTVTGKYLMVDGQTEVVFINDGKVSGLPNANGFAINVDLKIDPMSNLDEITFSDKAKRHYESYTFKISKDTLKLYNILANADSTEAIVGPLKYQLIRKK